MSPGRRIVLAVLAIVITACAAGRPDAAEWLPEWTAMMAVIPDQTALGEPPDETLCQTTLAGIRGHSETILPTPSQTVDDLVDDWVAIAEAAFFECPPDSEEISSFEDAYEQLATVEESIMSTLEDQD